MCFSDWFVSHTHLWFLRGGDLPLGTGASVFAFARSHGSVDTWISFRESYYDLKGLNKKETKIIDIYILLNKI
jgi:hypothetical protein